MRKFFASVGIIALVVFGVLPFISAPKVYAGSGSLCGMSGSQDICPSMTGVSLSVSPSPMVVQLAQ